MSLIETFRGLPTPSKGAYSAEPDTGQRCRVARGTDDRPAILIAFKREVAGAAGVRLANLEYNPPTEVEVVGSSAQARVAILSCRMPDPDLVAYFFRVAQVLILDDAQTEDEAHFAAALDTIVKLFRAQQRPGIRTVQGLWAELALILWSAKPTVAISAWHSEAHDLHDFSAGSCRLEVKSTIKKLREHAFLLDQIAVSQPGHTVVASLILTEDPKGTTLSDLLDQVRERIHSVHEVEKRLEVIVTESLGTSWKDATGSAFDLEGARASMKLYSAQSIPTVPQPIPAAVKEVRFTSDLSNSPWLEIGKARQIAQLYADLLPDTD